MHEDPVPQAGRPTTQRRPPAVPCRPMTRPFPCAGQARVTNSTRFRLGRARARVFDGVAKFKIFQIEAQPGQEQRSRRQPHRTSRASPGSAPAFSLCLFIYLEF